MPGINVYLLYNKLTNIYAVNLKNERSIDSAATFSDYSGAIAYLKKNISSLGKRKVNILVSKSFPELKNLKDLEQKIKDLKVEEF
jgi:hypothetical protein